MTPEQRARVAAQSVGKTIVATEWDDVGRYWVLDFEDGTELAVRLMADETANEVDDDAPKVTHTPDYPFGCSMEWDDDQEPVPGDFDRFRKHACNDVRGHDGPCICRCGRRSAGSRRR